MKKGLIFVLVVSLLTCVAPLPGVMAEESAESVWMTGVTSWDIEEEFNGVDAWPFQAEEELSSPKTQFAATNSVPGTQWTTDPTRLYRAAKDTPAPFLTYHLSGQDITYFKLSFGTLRNSKTSWSNTTWPKPVVQISKDGVTFSDLPEGEVYPFFTDASVETERYRKQAQVEAGGLRYEFSYQSAWGQNFAGILTPAATLPEGTKYIRVKYEKGTSNTQLQLTKLSISSEKSAALESKLKLSAKIEQAEGYQKLGELSFLPNCEANDVASLKTAVGEARRVVNDVASDTAAYDAAAGTLSAALIEFMAAELPTQAVPFHDPCEALTALWDGGLAVKPASGETDGITVGDVKRFVKNGVNDRAPASIIYRLNDSFDHFKVIGMLCKTTDGIENDFTFQVRGEDSDWVGVTDLVTVKDDSNVYTWGTGKYRSVTYEGYNIPDDARYIRINFARSNPYGNTYYNAVTDVMIDNDAAEEAGAYYSGCVVKNGQGEIVDDTSGLKTGGTFAITADIRNNPCVDAGLTSADVIAVVYDYGTDSLITCGVQRVTFLGDGFDKNEVPFQVTLPDGLIKPNVRFLILDSVNNIKPLTSVNYAF